MTPEPTALPSGPGSGPTASDSTRLVARCPEDVLAVVPVVLGFEPEDSLVMLTFGAGRPFHARVDLPGRRAELSEMVESLLAPALQHRVSQVLLVGYGADGGLAERAVREAARTFPRHGIGVIEGLRTDGRRWWPVPPRAGVPAHGVPYDLAVHPFAAQAVYDGRVVHASREELRATLAADPERVGRVVAALAALTGAPAPPMVEGAWARELVAHHAGCGSPPTDAEVARLLRGILETRVRDAAWSPLRRANSGAHVAFWADVLRRTPDPMAAAPAALLAFAAWQSGQGALAWCALDRCADVDPDYSLAGLVTHALTAAVPPDTWEEGFDWTEGLGHLAG